MTINLTAELLVAYRAQLRVEAKRRKRLETAYKEAVQFITAHEEDFLQHEEACGKGTVCFQVGCPRWQHPCEHFAPDLPEKCQLAHDNATPGVSPGLKGSGR